MNFIDKHVIVAGTGISGIGAAKLLVNCGAKVKLYDGNESLDQTAILSQLPNSSNVTIALGDLKKDMVEWADLMVISPGIPVDAPFAVTVKEANIPIWSEIELAYQIGRGNILAITGTNGKTTTTALVGKIMRDYYSSVFVVGNIGTPYTEVVESTRDDSVIVAEISSFQLETIVDFKPIVSAILNITPDHLDRHKTLECYRDIKLSITKNQTSNEICVLNYDDIITREMAVHMKAVPFFFSLTKELDQGIYLSNDSIIIRIDGIETVLCKVDELHLLGKHNIENVMAAAAMAIHYHVPISAIRESVKGFTAVEHRIEFVDTVEGVDYYNDSKGTNPDAAIKGINAMVKPTYLIGGGYDKGTEFDDWILSFQGKVKLLVLLGATAPAIAKTAHKYGFTDIVFAASLEEAVKICYERAVSGEAVLLSPACASWGMFKNYEERGRMFKEYVDNLKE